MTATRFPRRRSFTGPSLGAVILALLACAAAVAGDVQASPYASEPDLIEVVFEREARVRLRGGSLVDLGEISGLDGVDAVLAGVGWSEWWRGFQTPEETIDALTAEAEARTGRQLPDPNNLHRLRIGPGADVWEIARELEALPGIRWARPVPLPMALPTPDFEPQQGYLRPASTVPAGIDAYYAWTQPGGDAAGVSICDLEYSWNWMHDDLFPVYELHLYIQDPQSDDRHGTAVLGVMGSHSNGWGTTGIAHAGQLYTCGTYFKPIGGTVYSWDVPVAIVDAACSSSILPGDVLLIEHQWDLGGGAYVPIEWWGNSYPNQTFNPVYENIQWVQAVKHLIVVEPAGNGAVDLDGLNWYGDSGAIIVGAGGVHPGGAYPEGDLQRLSFSSYGARVNLQGWGEDVVTTGYGTLYNAEGVNRHYTATFDGTSSASPIVAGAVACCSGYWRQNVSSRFPLHPAYARALLEATGTPQVTPPAGNTGPRPDLLAALPRLDDWVDVSSGPILDTGGFASWGDYDGDHDADLYVLHSPYITNKLLRNDGGALFTDVTPDLLKDLNGYGGGAIWGDYDNDGDLDLYLANAGGSYNKLFRNDGGAFVDATSGPLGWGTLGSRPTWVDYDCDGDIDLYVAKYGGANKLLRNDGGGAFVDATSGPEGDAGYTSGVAWVDYDLDGDLDLFLSNWNSTSKLLRNDDGVFTDVTPAALAVSNAGTPAWGDYDNDGDFDLYLVIPTWGSPNKLFRNDGGGAFSDVTASPLGDTQHNGMAGWVDCDNDGDLDLYLVNNDERNRMFRNDAGGLFADDTHGLLLWEGYSSAVSWGDYDNDGDLDGHFPIQFPSGSNTLARNDATGSNHWLQVRLVGATANRSGIGARVRIVTSRGQQVRDVRADALEHTLVVSFGLGSQTSVGLLQVIWPGGAVQDSAGVAADQLVVIAQPGGSAVEEPVAPGEPEGPEETDEIRATRLHACVPSLLAGSAPAQIRYELGAAGPVRLWICDPAGRVVRVLAEGGQRAAGSHRAAWDGCGQRGGRVAPGVYFIRLEAGEVRASSRVMVLQ